MTLSRIWFYFSPCKWRVVSVARTGWSFLSSFWFNCHLYHWSYSLYTGLHLESPIPFIYLWDQSCSSIYFALLLCNWANSTLAKNVYSNNTIKIFLMLMEWITIKDIFMVLVFLLLECWVWSVNINSFIYNLFWWIWMMVFLFVWSPCLVFSTSESLVFSWDPTSSLLRFHIC